MWREMMKIKMWILMAAAVGLFSVSCAKKDKENDAAQVQNEEQETPPEDDADAQAETPAPTTPPPAAVASVKFPVVFHHGFMDSSRNRESDADVLAAAKKSGAEKIFYTEVSPANTIEFRAEQLASEVDRVLAETGAEKVNIVAHSIGGLDARYLVSSLEYGDRVASVTTIGTPHRGTPVAQLIVDYSPESLDTWIDNILGFAGGIVSSTATDESIDVIATFENLTEEYMTEEFNPENEDVAGVFYQSWGGTTGIGTGHSPNSAMSFSSALLMLNGGANDGVVHETSSRWGEWRGSLKADHIDLSGRKLKVLGGDGFNFPKFIEIYVKDLVEKGY
jgi:triacylglycerol lipase